MKNLTYSPLWLSSISLINEISRASYILPDPCGSKRNSLAHRGSSRSPPTADYRRPCGGGLEDLLSEGWKGVTLSKPPLRDQESLGKGGSERGPFRGRRRVVRPFLGDSVSTLYLVVRQFRRWFANSVSWLACVSNWRLPPGVQRGSTVTDSGLLMGGGCQMFEKGIQAPNCVLRSPLWCCSHPDSFWAEESDLTWLGAPSDLTWNIHQWLARVRSCTEPSRGQWPVAQSLWWDSQSRNSILLAHPHWLPDVKLFQWECHWSPVEPLSGPQRRSLSHSWVTKDGPLSSLRCTKDIQKSSNCWSAQALWGWTWSLPSEGRKGATLSECWEHRSWSLWGPGDSPGLRTGACAQRMRQSVGCTSIEALPQTSVGSDKRCGPWPRS